MRKPTLAIVSTLDDLCGIAGYARFLKKQLSDEFDVEIFDLDQYFMRGTHPLLVKQADKLIADIANELKRFDAVNIQLEYGIYGRKNKDIVRRLKCLINSASNISITFHTILPQAQFGYIDFFSDLFKFKFMRSYDRLNSYRNRRYLMTGVYSAIRSAQKQKNVSLIVHTQRDQRLMEYVHRFDRVFDHPLSFISPSDAALIRSDSSKSKFPQLEELPENSILVGVFGFLGEYKGFDTAIKSLAYLPETYHLAIFGGLHPNEIHPNQPVHPYVHKLLASFDSSTTGKPESNSAKSENLSKRVHFMGPQSDAGFAEAMALCDCVVFPYLEVGQSSSGPISIAVDMSTPIIASRNHAFMQFARYHPDFGETFEIGNYHELAEKITGVMKQRKDRPFPTFTTLTNAKIYKDAHEKIESKGSS